MSPDEAALLKAKLDGSPVLDAAPTFSDRMLGGVAGMIPGVGPVLGAGLAARSIYRELDPDRQAVVRDAAKEGLTSPGPLAQAVLPDDGMSSLSRRARDEVGAVDNVGVPIVNRPKPMNTPFDAVAGAPTLDPRYGQIGRPTGGMGGGGSPGPGLKGAFDRAQQNELDQMRTGRELEGVIGDHRVEKTAAMVGENQQFAAKQAADAQRMQQLSDDTHAHFQTFMDRTNKMVDEVANAKPDPGRYMRNQSNAMKITFGIGAIASGMLRGLQGGPNEFMKSLDHYINQDIESQQQEIDNKKSAISARQSLFGQMLSESGDRRLAADQYRRLMYESVKTDLAAKSDLYGIPEAKATTALVMNGIDQKIAGAESGIAKSAWTWAQQQAAAAAAARAAAEKQAWDRQVEMLKLGFEKDKVGIEAFKAEHDKEAVKEDNQQLNEATKRLGDDKVISNRETINGMFQKIRPDGSIVGFDATSRAKVGAVHGATFGALDPNQEAKLALSGDERIAHQQWQQLALAFQKSVTGTGGSDEQMQKIGEAFEGARTVEERANAIRMLKAELDRKEALSKAILNDDQKKTLDKRLSREGLSPDMPKSVKLK